MSDRINAIWGFDVVDEGWTSVPNVLIRNQVDLNITSEELNLILQVMSFKFDVDNPYPKTETIAERMGVKKRQAFNISQSIKAKGYLEKYQHDGKTVWNFKGLMVAMMGFNRDAKNCTPGDVKNCTVQKIAPEEDEVKSSSNKTRSNNPPACEENPVCDDVKTETQPPPEPDVSDAPANVSKSYEACYGLVKQFYTDVGKSLPIRPAEMDALVKTCQTLRSTYDDDMIRDASRYADEARDIEPVYSFNCMNWLLPVMTADKSYQKNREIAAQQSEIDKALATLPEPERSEVLSRAQVYFHKKYGFTDWNNMPDKKRVSLRIALKLHADGNQPESAAQEQQVAS